MQIELKSKQSDDERCSLQSLMMKVAIAHDYLRHYGDAERTLQVLHRLYPEAPVYVAFVDTAALGDNAKRFAGWDLRPTFAQRLPGITHRYHFYRSLLPYFWESLDLSSYDLVISSTSDYFAQAVLTRSPTLHISYCHSLPRYLWDPIEPEPIHWYSHWTNTRLRQYDYYSAQRVDRFVSRSETVARRIRKFYCRPAEVIAPPVPVKGIGQAGGDYYLYVGDLNRLQQVHLAVEACSRLGRSLWVVGSGSEAKRLQQLAGTSVRFLGDVPLEQMDEIYAGAIALITPSVHEDFSFATVEAMGHGIPAIAAEHSDIKDVILNYRTGLLFSQPTVESLETAMIQFEKLRFSAQACIERAAEFAESVFISKFQWFVAKALDDHHAQGAGKGEKGSDVS